MSSATRHADTLRRLHDPQSIVVAVESAPTAGAVADLAARARTSPPGGATLLVIRDISPQLVRGGLEKLVVALQTAGFVLIDAVFLGRDATIFFRAGQADPSDDLAGYVAWGDAELVLVYPHPNDLLRRFPVLAGRFYEQGLLEHIAARCRGGVAADIGAHVGHHTVFLAHAAGMQVFAFEPDRSNYACLERNIATNGVGAQVKTFNLALGARSGSGAMSSPPKDNSGAAKFVEGRGEIERRPLDDVLKDVARLDVIKIDVEGAEAEVLAGAQRLIARFHPDLYVELLTETVRADVSGMLAALGYRARQHFGGRDNLTVEFLHAG